MNPNKQDPSSWKDVSCITFALDTQRKRKRAKFEDSRKSEVATIRRKGACLRCRLLKASCSEVRPCDNCVRARLSSHVQVHKWMNCVSVSLKDINVFQKVLQGTSTQPNAETLDLEHLFSVPILLCGEGQVIWSLEWLAVHISSWVGNRKSLGFSRTGVLASARLQTLLEPFLGKQVSDSLRALVLSTLLSYNLGHDNSLPYISRHRDAFHLARATSADKLLRYLEETLTVSFLTKSKVDHRRLHALIILAFGVMRSLAYFDDTEVRKCTNTPRIVRKAFSIFHNASEMRDQLAGTLAHFIILLVDRLGTHALRDKMPIIVDNVQSHSTRPFISPLFASVPLPADPFPNAMHSLDGSYQLETTGDQVADAAGPSTQLEITNFPAHWQPSATEKQPIDMDMNSIFDTSDDLQQWLCNDIDALNSCCDPTENQYASSQCEDARPYRECVVCSSPLRHEDFDALCISCQQPPYEQWPGVKRFNSADSSLVTIASSYKAADRSGHNSLSTSMTSQDSTFDERMSSRGHRSGARATMPTPVEEETDDASWMFEAEDMDFSSIGPSSIAIGKAPAADDDVFPSEWTLYWEDSCDEQSVHDELDTL